jgi:uncharacterized protein YbjQ (UPF0145 family)
MPDGTMRSASGGRPTPALSDLSVTEFLALARMGFLPHGLVIGCAIWDAGQASARWSTQGRTVDGIAIATAMRNARQAALARMWDQARALGAEGVVGVRLEHEHHIWHGGHNVAKILAVGTAIGFDKSHAPHEFANAPSLMVAGGPFTSDLTGQDFVALLRSGYRPIALATGNALYAIDPSYATRYWMSSQNVEMTEYTQAFFDAREEAMDRLVTDLFRMFPPGHPDAPVGIVGMEIEEQVHGGKTGFVEFSAVGTAIAPLHPDDPRIAKEHPTPTVVVPLDR